MPLHDISYKHWHGVHLGLWSRRLVIARNGLTACLRNKWLRHVVVLCWGTTLLMTALLFMVGQLLVADSIVVQWVGNFNPGLQSFARFLTTWLEQHPEISVRTLQNVMFYFFCIYLLRACIFVLGMAIPILITRDLASNAIIIYSSKAVSRGDYLLGKFSTAFGLMALTWLGPVCVAWFLGNLLTPDWRFFWHSRAALFHILVFGLSSMTILSLIALGVSAISIKEKSTTAIWYIWWIIGGVVAPIAIHTQPWLQHVSFNYNLNQIALAVFHPGDDLTTAQDSIPILGDMLRNIRPQTMNAFNTPNIWGAVLWSLLMLGLAALIIRKRVKPE
jgi:ABC-2 type transport system permease protein